MKINISIDDVSPHPKSSIRVIDRCFELINEFPNVKFTLFVPIAYWRTVKKEISTVAPLSIDAHPDFCDFLKKLPTSNFEIGYHGFYHGIPHVSDNDEFQNLSYDEACQKFDIMFSVVGKAGLKNTFKPIFRPPAWRMSPGAIRAAKDMGIKLLALSRDDYALNTYENENNNFPNVNYYNCSPPFKDLKKFEINEIVYHACEWDKNFLSVEQTGNLSSFLKSHDDTQFCFMEEML